MPILVVYLKFQLNWLTCALSGNSIPIGAIINCSSLLCRLGAPIFPSRLFSALLLPAVFHRGLTSVSHDTLAPLPSGCWLDPVNGRHWQSVQSGRGERGQEFCSCSPLGCYWAEVTFHQQEFMGCCFTASTSGRIGSS